MKIVAIIPEGTKFTNDNGDKFTSTFTRKVTVHSLNRDKNTGETVISWRGHRDIFSAPVQGKVGVFSS